MSHDFTIIDERQLRQDIEGVLSTLAIPLTKEIKNNLSRKPLISRVVKTLNTQYQNSLSRGQSFRDLVEPFVDKAFRNLGYEMSDNKSYYSPLCPPFP